MLDLVRRWNLCLLSPGEPTFENARGMSCLDFFLVDAEVCFYEHRVRVDHSLDDITDHHAILGTFNFPRPEVMAREFSNYRVDLLVNNLNRRTAY